MNIRIFIIFFCMLWLVACQYDVPLSTEHNIPIDVALLGNWEMIPDEDSPTDSVDQMMILRYSDTQYLIRYRSEGSEMYFRAYSVVLADMTMMQLELLGSEDGPIQRDKENRRFIVTSYQFIDGQIEVKTLNTEVVSSDISDSESLREAFLLNRDNPELFGRPGRFKRTGAAKRS